MIKKKGKKTSKIDSVYLSESVSQQRSLNELLDHDKFLKGGFLRRNQSTKHLQPLHLREDTPPADSLKFGLEITKKSQPKIIIQNDAVIQLLQQNNSVSISKTKSVLQPLLHDRIQPLEIMRAMNEADVSQISRNGSYQHMNLGSFSLSQPAPYQQVIQSLVNNQSKRVSIMGLHSAILNPDNSTINFVEDSLLAQFNDIPASQLSNQFQDTQQRIQKDLPPINDRFKHFLMLFTLLENHIKQDDYQYLKHLQTMVKQLNIIFSALLSALSDSYKKVEKIQEEKNQIIQKNESEKKYLKELTEMIKVKDDQLKFFQDTSMKGQNVYQLKNNTERLRNAQLEKQLELCQEKLNQIMSEGENGSYSDILQKENEKLREQIKIKQFEYFQLSQQYDKSQQQMQIFKHQVQKSEKQFTMMDGKITEYETIIKGHNEVLEKAMENKKQYYEQAQMAREELITIKYNANEFVKSMSKNIEKIKLLQIRIDEMTVKRSKELDAPVGTRMNKDEETIKVVNTILDQDQQFKKLMMSNFQRNTDLYDSKLLNIYAMQNKKQQQSNENATNLSTLRLNYPGFLSLLDKKQIDLEWPYLASRSLQNIFIAQLRAILDTMFIQFQSLSFMNKSIPSFQSFVYQWLSNFTIDEQRRCVIALPENMQRNKVEEHILNFYLDLHIPRLDKVWEIVQFKHFLSDAYSTEELYVYLHARHMLRRGPWLHTLNSFTSIMHYTSIEQAQGIVTRFMTNFDSVNIQLVMRSLQERTVDRGSKKLIETCFVLQILIEMFRIELQNRYRALSSSFPKQPVSFRAFHRFVKGNYPGATESEVVELWRETSLLTSGHPNVTAFYITGTFLFVKSLKLPSLWENHAIDENNNIIYDERNFAILQVVERLSDINQQDLDDFINVEIPSMGNEEYVRIGKYLKKPRKDSPPALMIATNIVYLTSIYNLWKKQSRYISLQGIVEVQPDVNRYLEICQQMIKEQGEVKREQKVLNDLRSIKIANFQRMARRKMIKFYLIIASVLTGVNNDLEKEKIKQNMKEQAKAGKLN